jgi:hypothetical protein
MALTLSQEDIAAIQAEGHPLGIKLVCDDFVVSPMYWVPRGIYGGKVCFGSSYADGPLGALEQGLRWDTENEEWVLSEGVNTWNSGRIVNEYEHLAGPGSATAEVFHVGLDEIADAVAAELAASLTVTTPVAATTEGGTVGDPLRITTWQHTRLQVLLTIEDAQGVDVDLSGHDLSMLIYDKAAPDTVIAEWTTGAELTAGLGTLAIDAPATDTADAGDFLFVIRDNGSDDTIWAHGSLKIKPAPDTPAAP